MSETDAPAYVTTRDGTPLGLIAVGTAYDPVYETISSDRPVRKPDHRWVERHGDHDHAWTDDERPTVLDAHREDRHVPCDGSCGGVCDGEGYHVPVWVCDVTDEDIEPGTVTGPAHVTFLTSETFEVTVILDTAREFPPTIMNAQIRQHIGEGLHYIDLPDVMTIGEVTYGGGPSSATYSGGPMPRHEYGAKT